MQCRPSAGRPPPLHPIVRETPRVLHVTNGDSAARPAARRGRVRRRAAVARRAARGTGPRRARRRAAARRARPLHRRARLGGRARARSRTMTRARRAARRARSPPARRSCCGSSPTSTTSSSSPRSSTASSPARARLVLVGVERVRRRRRARRRASCSDRMQRRRRRSTADEVAAARALWDAFRAPDPRGARTRSRRAPRRAPRRPPPPAAVPLARRRPEPHRARAARRPSPTARARPPRRSSPQQRQEERPFLGDAIAFEYLAALAATASEAPRDPGRRARVGGPAGALARRRPPAGRRAALALRPGDGPRRLGALGGEHPAHQLRRAELRQRLVEVAALGRLHARRAALLARALADQPVRVVDQRVEREEAAARDPDPARDGRRR